LNNRTGNVIMPSKFLCVPLWLGDLVARKKSHEDTRAQRFHNENQLKKPRRKNGVPEHRDCKQRGSDQQFEMKFQ